MTCIVVIGMGRSGTSLLSQILQAKGVSFGTENDLIGKIPINVSGQMEHIPIQYIHRELLKNVFDINTWLFKGSFEKNWHKHDVIKPYKELLKKELHKLEKTAIDCKQLTGDKFFGFKDARTTMLLPMWEDIFEEEGIDRKYVLCLRDPKAVFNSLIRASEVLSLEVDEKIDFNSTYFDLFDIWTQYNRHARYVEIATTITYENWFKTKQELLLPQAEQDNNLSDSLGLLNLLGMSLIHSDEKHF